MDGDYARKVLAGMPIIIKAKHDGILTIPGRTDVKSGARASTYYLQEKIVKTQRIIISGGVYQKTHMADRRYYYQFIDGAIAQINEWLPAMNTESENIVWLIADHLWTEWDKDVISKYYYQNNSISTHFISSIAQITQFINFGTFRTRKVTNRKRLDNKITHISVFSHGLVKGGGEINLSYDYADGNFPILTWTKADIPKMKPEAFFSTYTHLYTCNAGSSCKESFAQLLAEQTGGITDAYKGKTDYELVADQSFSAAVERLNGNHYFGGSPNLPTAATGAEKITFPLKKCICEKSCSCGENCEAG